MANCLKETCILAVATLLASSAPTLAQDWSGAFYGGSLGYGTGSYTQGIEARDLVGVDVEVSGLIYGAHAGFRMQSGALVFGIDAGLSSGPDGATGEGADGPNIDCNTGDCLININALGTLRARVGVVTDIRTVVYGAAGLAVATVDGGIANSFQEGSSTATGVTYALGVERITSPFSTIFAEIGYYDLGTLTFGTDENFGQTPPPTLSDFTAEGDFLTLTIGVNYAF